MGDRHRVGLDLWADLRKDLSTSGGSGRETNTGVIQTSGSASGSTSRCFDRGECGGTERALPRKGLRQRSLDEQQRHFFLGHKMGLSCHNHQDYTRQNRERRVAMARGVPGPPRQAEQPTQYINHKLSIVHSWATGRLGNATRGFPAAVHHCKDKKIWFS